MSSVIDLVIFLVVTSFPHSGGIVTLLGNIFNNYYCYWHTMTVTIIIKHLCKLFLWSCRWDVQKSHVTNGLAHLSKVSDPRCGCPVPCALCPVPCCLSVEDADYAVLVGFEEAEAPSCLKPEFSKLPLLLVAASTCMAVGSSVCSDAGRAPI